MSIEPITSSNSPRFRPTRAAPKDKFAIGKPACPSHIKADAVALECWRRIVKLLSDRGVCTRGDGPSIELYVASYCDWLEARKEVKEHGLIVETVTIDSEGESHTVRKENPAQKIVDRCSGMMRQLLKEFGATPAARERAKVAKGFKPKEPLPIGSVGYILEHDGGSKDESESSATEPEKNNAIEHQ
jgi:P27 family predicted phage terminase small subunit